MHATELHFLAIAKRYAAVGMQAAQAYNQEQARLDLAAVLTPARLSSPQGTQESLATLDDLRRLTFAHREAYRKFVLTAAAELKAAVDAMPPDTQAQQHDSLVSSINWQLAAQSAFYVNRERWIDAAQAICQLIDARRSTCVFGEQGVDFADDGDLDRFEALLATVEDAHRVEVAALQERLARLNRSLGVLSTGPAARS